MTNNPKPESGSHEEVDPLSATAMFLRTLDKQQEAGHDEPSAGSGIAPDGRQSVPRDFPPASSTPESDKGEFTAIFGRSSPRPSSQATSVPVAATPVPRPVTEADPAPPAKEGPGEFTRIFVKGSAMSPKPLVRNMETSAEPAPATPPSARGFSAPGVSDAASNDASFTNFFKLNAKGANSVPQPREPLPTPERPPETPLRDRSSRSEASIAGSNQGQISPAPESQSITSIIESLSSPANRAEPAPYQTIEPTPASYQPPLKSNAQPDFDSGGVTQFIHKLTDAPPAPAPAPAPVREPNPGPGEYTRIISARNQPVPTATPDSPAAQPAAPASGGPAFVRPAVPAMPAVAPIPQRPQMSPPAAPAAIPVAMPAPKLPPAPVPAALAPPKGKMEALTPVLLIINTFLLVTILVVLLFLIKGR